MHDACKRPESQKLCLQVFQELAKKDFTRAEALQAMAVLGSEIDYITDDIVDEALCLCKILAHNGTQDELSEIKNIVHSLHFASWGDDGAKISEINTLISHREQELRTKL
jgi:hypothetical protein